MEKIKTYFTDEETLFDITDRYPETLEIFAANGFPQLKEKSQREGMGRMLTFEAALRMKKKNIDLFRNMLFDIIAEKHKTQEEGTSAPEGPAVCDFAGILPCPVKLPLLEGFESFVKKEYNSKGQQISYRLKSASGGIQWLEEEVEKASSVEEIPDLFISAGFELFFDKKLIGQYRDQGVFSDLSGLSEFHSCFDGLDLKDPRGNYSILAAVPAVFLVNRELLGDRKAPETWEDLLSPELENSISLPVEDMDLFNAVILTLLKEYGEEGVIKLGRNMLKSLHPSQMVKGQKGSGDQPAVTVLPWFFTKMVFPGSGMEMVWPKDGAILSPIFSAAKKEKAEILKPLVQFFESEETGRLFRDRGYFPSVNPSVDNNLDMGRGFRWLGWDYIYSHNITDDMKRAEKLFFEGEA